MSDPVAHGGVWHRNVILYYLTRFPDRDVAFMNSGSGGDNAANALKVRLEPDVVARKPNVVVVMFGMNDFGFSEYVAAVSPEQIARQGRLLAAYRTNMDLLVSAIEKGIPGVRLYLMTPTPFDDTAVYPDGKKVNCSIGDCPHCAHLPRGVERLAVRGFVIILGDEITKASTNRMGVGEGECRADGRAVGVGGSVGRSLLRFAESVRSV